MVCAGRVGGEGEGDEPFALITGLDHPVGAGLGQIEADGEILGGRQAGRDTEPSPGNKEAFTFGKVIEASAPAQPLKGGQGDGNHRQIVINEGDRHTFNGAGGEIVAAVAGADDVVDDGDAVTGLGIAVVHTGDRHRLGHVPVAGGEGQGGRACCDK